VAQPSLSAQLAQLEAALEVQLFERDQRRVLPTAAGRELVERARRLLVASEDLSEAARRVSDPFAGTLRVGVIPTISPYLLPLIVPRLRAELPRLTVAWVEDKTEILAAQLGDGRLDAALVALEAELGEVERAVVGEDRFVLAAAADHPLVKVKHKATAKDLRGAGVLLLGEGHCFRNQALAFCSTARAQELEYRATSLATLVQMVAGGAGVTLLPALALPAETAHARLRWRDFADPAPHRTIGLVWRKHSPRVEVFQQLAGLARAALARRVTPG
jgi:LysR family hydrogen peroxide-inducible transcriptional activator